MAKKDWKLNKLTRWQIVYAFKPRIQRKLLINYENDNKNWAVHDSSIWLKGYYFKTKEQALKQAIKYMMKH